MLTLIINLIAKITRKDKEDRKLIKLEMNRETLCWISMKLKKNSLVHIIETYIKLGNTKLEKGVNTFLDEYNS